MRSARPHRGRPDAMAPGLGPRLRHLLNLFRADFAPKADNFPDLAAALDKLQAEVEEAFPRSASVAPRGVGRPRVLASDRLRQLQNQLHWARKAKKVAVTKLQLSSRGKDSQHNNRMTPEFLAKVPGNEENGQRIT